MFLCLIACGQPHMLLIQEMNVKPGGMFSRCVEDYIHRKIYRSPVCALLECMFCIIDQRLGKMTMARGSSVSMCGCR